MGQARVIIPVKGILEKGHSRQSEIIPQSSDRRGDGTQILGNQSLPSATLLEGFQQLATGGFTPGSDLGGPGPSLDVPGLLEPHEMIDPNNVEAVELGSETADPPFEVRPLVHRPSVLGMTPELSLPTELIGWNTGDHGGSSRSVQLEELGVGVHVS
jgi:hypothetical protein